MMKKPLLCILLFCVAGFCFSQQFAIKGIVPDSRSPSLYRVQVGAFALKPNADAVFRKLQDGGLAPELETAGSLTRVLFKKQRFEDIYRLVQKIKSLGFAEVWVSADGEARAEERPAPASREEKPAISEKWEVTSGESKYESFEFNRDNTYIVTETERKDERPVVHFGDYEMPSADLIRLVNLGLLKIDADNGGKVAFSFTEAGAEEPVKFEAEKAALLSESEKTDIFSKTWRVVVRDGVDVRGTDNDRTILFSRAGTYLVTTLEGFADTAKWKWENDSEESFLYTWDPDWEDYGTATILELAPDRLVFRDSTYGGYFPVPMIMELVPAK